MRQDVSLPLRAKRAAAELGRRVGLSAARISEVQLGVTEAAVNLNRHAVDGALLLRLVEAGPAAVELLAIDQGPGMADVAHARRDGVSSAGTLGIGLGVVERYGRARAPTRLVLCTDGLVEVRGVGLDEGLVAFETAVAEGSGGLEDLCDALLNGFGRGKDDDIALLAADLVPEAADVVPEAS